jgi:hypothetical protein
MKTPFFMWQILKNENLVFEEWTFSSRINSFLKNL